MRTWSDIEKVAEIQIPEVVRRCVPTGDKVLIVVEMPERMTQSGLYKPDEVIAKDGGGSGWVVALGPAAGAFLCAAAGTGQSSVLGFTDSDREKLRGLKVGFGKFAGEALSVYDTDEGFQGRFRMIPEERILLVFDVT